MENVNLVIDWIFSFFTSLFGVVIGNFVLACVFYLGIFSLIVTLYMNFIHKS